MAPSIHTVTPQRFLPLSKSIKNPKPRTSSITSPKFSITKQNDTHFLLRSMPKELDVIPVQSSDSTDQEDGGFSIVGIRREVDTVDDSAMNHQVVGGFGNKGRLSFKSAGFSSRVASSIEPDHEGGEEEFVKLVDRTINATIVLAAGSFAITKLLTIDQDYWHGWTLYEILRYAPQHNWSAYEEALKTNPVLAKMMISGVVYSLGDWIAQVGWKLWPFTHLIIYGVVPVEQRLLWVDCIELIWVTILSTLSNENSESRISESPAEPNSNYPPSLSPPEE